jgi:orotate phosphoribosyltransferase
MNIFQKQEVKLNSGEISDFKIECDALTYADIECIAYLISKRVKFKKAIGVPTGGIRIAEAVNIYSEPNSEELPILIVDDVLTSGGSMERFKSELGATNVIGVVIFARQKCSDWITPLFSLCGEKK